MGPNPFRPGTTREQIDRDVRRGHVGADPSDPPPSDPFEHHVKRAARWTAEAKAIIGSVAAIGSVLIAAIVWGLTRASTAYVDEKVRIAQVTELADHEHVQAQLTAINENRAAMLEQMRAQREALEKLNEQVKEIRGYVVRGKP